MCFRSAQYKKHRILMPDGSEFTFNNKKESEFTSVGVTAKNSSQRSTINSDSIFSIRQQTKKSQEKFSDDENAQIRYSVQNDFDSALEAYDNGEISQDEFREIANEEYGKKLNQHGAIPTGEKAGNDPISVPKSVDGKEKIKRFVRTVIEKKDLTQNMIEELGTSILKGEMSYHTAYAVYHIAPAIYH